VFHGDEYRFRQPGFGLGCFADLSACLLFCHTAGLQAGLPGYTQTCSGLGKKTALRGMASPDEVNFCRDTGCISRKFGKVWCNQAHTTGVWTDSRQVYCVLIEGVF